MTYELVITRRAEKDIARLDPVAKQRVKEALQEYLKDPLRHARKLLELSLGTYRFRIGDYRVIFDLEGDKLVVLRVGHRREIYRS